LGKPGSGKTTFLKYAAIQCSLGKFQANLVPIFITLKDYAETGHQPSLLTYISEQFATYGITNIAAIKTILSQGRAFVLLEGLDQVREVDEERVFQEIRNFSAKFHANHFVITCRIGAREYSFEQFTEVEIADFDEEQITIFVTKWFSDKNASNSKKFINKLKQNASFENLLLILFG
jgi:predicted NACHT family NTPase